MKKLLLINTNTLRAPYPVPPVGLCLVAAALEGAYEVRLYDPVDSQAGDVVDVVAEFGPDYVGVGIRNVDDVVMTGGAFFIDEIRERFTRPLRACTRAPLILGGSGYTIFPSELLDVLDADFGVCGEGEIALPALLRALEAGTDPCSIPGVVCRGGTGPVARPPHACLAMADLPSSEIDRRLNYAPYAGRSAYPVQTKRGCAHACLYCSYPQLEGGCYRLRPIVHVVDEIEDLCQRLGRAPTVEFVDSVFNEPAGHAEALCREIAARDLGVRLRTMGVNPACVTPALIEGMKRAGFGQIDSTPDSASPTMLRNLCKNFSLDDLRTTARLIQEHEMPTMWFFLLGGPGESEATLQETFDFIDAYVAADDMVHMAAGIRIYPGTGLYETALQEGSVVRGASLLRPQFYVSPLLSPDRLGELVAQACRQRTNCVWATESTPSPDMLAAALRRRKEEGLTEPMFRTLLRLRRERGGRDT